jgi:hypothetical protein
MQPKRISISGEFRTKFSFFSSCLHATFSPVWEPVPWENSSCLVRTPELGQSVISKADRHFCARGHNLSGSREYKSASGHDAIYRRAASSVSPSYSFHFLLVYKPDRFSRLLVVVQEGCYKRTLNFVQVCATVPCSGCNTLICDNAGRHCVPLTALYIAVIWPRCIYRHAVAETVCCN